MDTAILKSIDPKAIEEIVNGKRKFLISKTTPKLEPPFKVYAYCTSVNSISLNEYVDLIINSNGKIDLWHKSVVAEFTCDQIVDIEVLDSGAVRNYWYYELDKSCLSIDEIAEYIGKEKHGYGLHISDLKVYDKPKELSEFYKIGAKELDDMQKTDDIEELCRYCYRTDYGKHASCVTPNGIEFCEGRYCDEAYKAYKDKNFRVSRPPIGWCYVEEV